MAAKDAPQINQQLALAMQYNAEASFIDFCWSGNELLQQQILSNLSEKNECLFYIWGVPGSGKTHLLQASCQASAQKGQTVAYLPLKLLKAWEPAILEGMADHALVAIDDIEQIAGQPAWEEALFHLYNQLQAQKSVLIITSQTTPNLNPIQLADLRSRLTYALILQIHELQDEDKISTLQKLAHQRGLDLPNSVGHFILNRCARNMHDLYDVLERLDHASLVAQRRLTIPFVKKILEV